MTNRPKVTPEHAALVVQRPKKLEDNGEKPAPIMCREYLLGRSRSAASAHRRLYVHGASMSTTSVTRRTKPAASDD